MVAPICHCTETQQECKPSRSSQGGHVDAAPEAAAVLAIIRHGLANGLPGAQSFPEGLQRRPISLRFLKQAPAAPEQLREPITTLAKRGTVVLKDPEAPGDSTGSAVVTMPATRTCSRIRCCFGRC